MAKTATMRKQIESEWAGSKKKDRNPDRPMGDTVPEFIALTNLTLGGELYF
jgi:hypothetical protein